MCGAYSSKYGNDQVHIMAFVVQLAEHGYRFTGSRVGLLAEGPVVAFFAAGNG